MNNLLVKIKYNGTNYVGWQVQRNGVSIQQCVQDAVKRICRVRVNVTGCSRTDSGVHANEYCLTLSMPVQMELKRIVPALNSVLPPDIAAFSVQPVDDSFHPRYNAKAKEYIYKIYDGVARNPFLDGLALHNRSILDVQMLNQAAKTIVGKQDFRAFMAHGSKITDTVREVFYCDVERFADNVQVKICADGFLYKMVRIIVGTLLYVNNGRIAANSIPDIILSKSRDNAGKTAPPYGLYLNRVFYEQSEILKP